MLSTTTLGYILAVEVGYLCLNDIRTIEALKADRCPKLI
jgi:hypothetical protein